MTEARARRYLAALSDAAGIAGIHASLCSAKVSQSVPEVSKTGSLKHTIEKDHVKLAFSLS
jgi:hypothetical protein